MTLAVTLTVDQLRELVREEVRAVLAAAPTQTETAVMDTEKAAVYLDIPVDSLRKRAAKGEIPSFKMGTHVRFRKAELEGWLAERKR